MGLAISLIMKYLKLNHIDEVKIDLDLSVSSCCFVWMMKSLDHAIPLMFQKLDGLKLDYYWPPHSANEINYRSSLSF